ncbi:MULTISPECIES: YeeE/YedE thiosulfate transporter family protein [unclassified Agrobacterium]|uniref:YeeE/YedE thiosulfate transporter family protein n=1 Tax=unclassified Agrobacterium TaxID=2632611 RepID=UPI001FCD7D5F|nr:MULTISPECIES: YeeE/YedE thiosulfate transporter family protein [unclassified Agrobacterium]
MALFTSRLRQALRSAAISAFSYFCIAPLGVTAELGSIVRMTGGAAGWASETLAGLDTVRGCISAVKTAILSPNGVFILGLMFASLASVLSAGKFQPAWPSAGGLAARFAGGVLMGWGGMTALGCTIGVFCQASMRARFPAGCFSFFAVWAHLPAFFSSAGLPCHGAGRLKFITMVR